MYPPGGGCRCSYARGAQGVPDVEETSCLLPGRERERESERERERERLIGTILERAFAAFGTSVFVRT